MQGRMSLNFRVENKLLYVTVDSVIDLLKAINDQKGVDSVEFLTNEYHLHKSGMGNLAKTGTKFVPDYKAVH